MRIPRMPHDHPSRTQSQGIAAQHRPIRYVGEFEAKHLLQANHLVPVCHHLVGTALGGENIRVGMRDDAGPRALHRDGAELHVGMVGVEYEPPDRLRGAGPDGTDHGVTLRRARQSTDHEEAVWREDEPRVGTTLDALAGVAGHKEHAGREFAQRIDRVRSRRGEGIVARLDLGADARGGDEGRSEQEGEAARQVVLNAICAVCSKTAPLLSTQRIVRGPSRSATSVKVTTGSRLMPDVHMKWATCRPA